MMWEVFIINPVSLIGIFNMLMDLRVFFGYAATEYNGKYVDSFAYNLLTYSMSCLILI